MLSVTDSMHLLVDLLVSWKCWREHYCICIFGIVTGKFLAWLLLSNDKMKLVTITMEAIFVALIWQQHIAYYRNQQVANTSVAQIYL